MAAKDPTELASLSSIAGGDLVLIYDSSDGNLKTATQSLLSNTVLADNESIQDAVGEMVSSNTETLITVTYDDLGGKLDFVVDNDLANYDNTTSGFITASSTDTLTNKTFDANGAGNSIINVEVADLAGSAKTGSDTTVVTGTAGTSGNVSIWNVDGDLVDSGSSIADLQQTDEEIQDVVGAMVSTNTETLITVTYQDADGTIDFVVDNNLSNYDNTTSGFITASSTDTLTNKSGNISQWTNDTGYITGSSTTTLTNKTFDANGAGNSITNLETADLAGSAKTGSDTTVVTGTAGTSGNVSIWNADGDLVDSGVASSDVVSLSGTNTFTGANTFSGGITLNAGEIDTADIADNAVSTAKIADNAVTAAKMSNAAFNKNFLHIQDQKTSGTSGGSTTGGSYAIRTLNTVLTNDISGASLASNKISLPAGTYYVEASAPANGVNAHQLGLYNDTDSTFLINGTQEDCSTNTAGDNVQNRAFVSGVFSLASTKDIVVYHYVLQSKATIGYGASLNTGEVEIYTDIKIWKVA